MATVYLDHSGLEIKQDGKALAIYESGQRQRSLPLDLLERVVIQGNITLNARVLGMLGEAGASVLFLTKRHSRRVAIVLGPPHRDARIRLAQYRAMDDAPFCARIGRVLLQPKFRAQYRFLERELDHRPQQRKRLITALQRIEQGLHQLADTAIVGREQMMGIEGSIASAGFAAYADLFAPQLGFGGRNRRPPRDPVNACLSLSYTLLHYEAVSTAHAVGLDPYLGFLHAPSHGRESLACDLIEPLRPRAEAWLLERFADRTLRADHFRYDGEACLLNKAGRARFYAAYESFASPRRRHLRRLARAIARSLLAETPDDDAGFETALS